jgi:hypothetical protein
VADRDFVFALELSGLVPPSPALLRELASDAFACAGIAAVASSAIVDWLQTAVAATGGRCHVRFRAEAGELEIVVSSSAGRIWRTSRAIP